MAPTFPSTTAPFVLAGLLALAAAPSVAQSQPSPKAQTVASGLQNPWAVAFLPDGRFLVTERPGRLRVVNADGQVQPAVQGLPEVAAGGQGGLLDVITDSAFASNRTIYFCFSEPGKGTTNSTALARARLSQDARRLEDVKVIFSQQPKFSSTAHFGCRIVERPDGTLFLTLGDRFSRRDDAQTLDNHHGKVVRVAKDGAIPKDNPFVGKAGALPEIWSYGHRNSQGATLAPDGSLWTHEHGARGGDELNQPQAGKDYGWPTITYGMEYSGKPIGAGLTAKEGMEQPVYYWDPVIAPAGMAFYEADLFPAWKGNILIGGLASKAVVRLVMQDGKVVGEERLLTDLNERIRDVVVGPDGALYLATDSKNGRVLKVTPKG